MYWYIGKNSNEETGMVPATCLQPVQGMLATCMYFTSSLDLVKYTACGKFLWAKNFMDASKFMVIIWIVLVKHHTINSETKAHICIMKLHWTMCMHAINWINFSLKRSHDTCTIKVDSTFFANELFGSGKLSFLIFSK